MCLVVIGTYKSSCIIVIELKNYVKEWLCLIVVRGLERRLLWGFGVLFWKVVEILLGLEDEERFFGELVFSWDAIE